MAWGARQNAAAQHLGAPSGHEQRYLNKASGKMETRHQMKAYNVAGRTPRKGEGQGGAHKPPAKPPPGAPRPHPSGGGESLPLAQLSPAQLAHRATKIGQGEQAAALNPLKAQANEINQNQSAVQGAYKGYGDSQNTLLSQLQEKQETSAKTAENQAAANAIQAGKSIETTGQAAATQTAGYISPELKAEMNAQGQRAVGMGGAGNALASNLGTNETNYLTNLRASAAQKILQGQQGIASTYGKQLGGVRAKESEVAGKLAPNIANKRGEMERTQFNQRATLQGLGLKQDTLVQKARGEGAKNKLAAQSIGQRERANQRTTATSRENSERTAATAAQNRMYKTTHPAGSKPTTPKAPSPGEGRKYMGNVSKALSIAQEQLGPKSKDHSRQEQVRHYLQSQNYSADQVSAAMNLAAYGVLGPQDRRTAEAYGLTPAMRKAWFQPHK